MLDSTKASEKYKEPIIIKMRRLPKLNVSPSDNEPRIGAKKNSIREPDKRSMLWVNDDIFKLRHVGTK